MDEGACFTVDVAMAESAADTPLQLSADDESP